jgi:hypothetical protein
MLCLVVVMGNPGLGRGHFWRWLCQNVAETVTHLILSSGGHNDTIPSMLSSKYMYYELNATIILDLCGNIHP